jgi:hypothetical protein
MIDDYYGPLSGTCTFYNDDGTQEKIEFNDFFGFAEFGKFLW